MHPNHTVQLYNIRDSNSITGNRFSAYTYPNNQLKVICHLVADVQLTILVWFILDCQQLKDLTFIDTNTSRDFGQPFIGLVACLIDNTDIKKLSLVLKEIGTELPEFFWRYLQNRGCCFMC